MIVLNIMEELVDETIAHDFHRRRRPIHVLKQYRRLLLTCKTFYDVIQNHNTKLSIVVDHCDGGFVVLRGHVCDPFDFDAGDEGYFNTFEKFSSFFMSWQLEVVTRCRVKYLDEENLTCKYIDPQFEEAGNFHLNPELDLDHIWTFQTFHNWLLRTSSTQPVSRTKCQNSRYISKGRERSERVQDRTLWS